MMRKQARNSAMGMGMFDNLTSSDAYQRLMANVTHRLLQDIAFYMSPATAMEILKNPTPLVKTLGDFMTAFKATYKYHTQDNYLGDPLLKKWSKTVPIGSPIYSLNYALTEDVDK